ncbi:MAG: hypothetical protein ABSE84_17800 [Isosphaeraceae bacterium]
MRVRPQLADELQQIMARVEPGTKNHELSRCWELTLTGRARSPLSLSSAVTNAARRLEFMDFSESKQTQTSYIMELFGVELGPGACSTVESDADNRWLSDAEIQAGRTHDGRRVSPTMRRLREAIRERIA